MSLSSAIRIALAVLYLVYAGLFVRAYNPQDPMSGAMLAFFGGLVLSSAFFAVMVLLRPSVLLLGVSIGLGALVAALQVIAWLFARTFDSSNPSSVREWDEFILPFIVVQIAIVVLGVLAVWTLKRPEG